MGGCSAKNGQVPKKKLGQSGGGNVAKGPVKKLNPADYLISKRTGEVIIRPEGSIDGQQFNIEECRDCDIFLFDVIATSFVDECENCRIFMGPIETSIMLRNCKSCSVILACQQFRSRDCQDCKLAMLCTTEPIIETSSRMQFACFDFCYFSLRQQLQKARMDPWNNKWWQVYDFNRNENQPNWRLMPQDEVRGMLDLEKCASNVSQEELEMDRVVPVTLGSRQRPSEESCLVLFLPDSDAYLEAFAAKVEREADWHLARSRVLVMDAEWPKQLFAWAKDAKLGKNLKGQSITGLELCGPGIFQKVQDALTGTGLAAGSKSIRLVPQDAAQTLTKSFFEGWKEQI